MNKRFELIYHEVKRKFKNERAFYHHTLGITQRAWEKYKEGETNFDNVKLSTYKSMMSSLFTPYETILIDEAIQSVNFNWHDNIVDAFHDIKVKKAKLMMKNGGDFKKPGANMETGQPTRNALYEIRVENEFGSLFFEIDMPSNRPEHHHLRVPTGKRNKQEWFDKYFEETVVK